MLYFHSQTHDGEVKLNAILDHLVSQLALNCSCSISKKYIAQPELTCDGSSTDRVVLQGAFVGTPERGGDELHAQLQQWVDEGQMIQVIGIPLEVVACSTYPGSEETCTASSATTPIIKVADETAQSSGLGGVPLYAAVVGGVALLVIVAIVIAVVIGVCRRRHTKKKYKTNR